MSIKIPSPDTEPQTLHHQGTHNTITLSIMHLEIHDTIDTVLDGLHEYTAPMLLMPSSQGELFRQEKHFAMLRLWMTAYEHTLGLCFIFSSRQTRERQLAAHYGFRYASSIDEAILHLLQTRPLHDASSRHATTALSRSSDPLLHMPLFRMIQKQANTTHSSQPLPERKQSYHLIVVLAILIVASILLLPLIFLSTPSPSHTGKSPIIDNLAFSQINQQATIAKNGRLDAKTGATVGGSLWLSLQLQQLASIPLHASTA